jgi:hypothetical protein
MDLTNEI